MNPTSVCLVGLPGAGKTTFLAAFWAAARDTPQPDRYQIAQFPGDPSYLQEIAEQWFQAKVVERNPSGSWKPIEMIVRAEGRTDLVLQIPDLSGESFRDAAADRILDEQVARLVSECDLILFFVNAATARTPVFLADLPPTKGETSEDVDDVVEFDPKELESDILNSELLQLLPGLRIAPEHPAPLIVIISAWDQVDGLASQSPGEWLTTNQPMFAQALAEYGRSAAVEIMGVSAQGGDYQTNPEVGQRPPSERPLVVSTGVRSSNIGLPFEWFDNLLREESDDSSE